MANRGMTVTGPTETSPQWAADCLHPDRLIPAGGRLDAVQFAEVAGKRYVPGGTLVGRTLAERDAVPPVGYGPWTAGDEEEYLIAFDVADANIVDEIELVRHNTAVKENYLPGWAGLAVGVQARIRALYRCVKGVD
jgi:hypothetical protein